MPNTLLLVDSEIYQLIQKENHRQNYCLELIASENFTSNAVMTANGSILTNKYSEGLPGKRYYGGNEFIDEIENICKERALNLYRLDSNQWSVNVQSYSGSTANFSVFTALLNPNDTIIGLDLPSGGHLTHGYQIRDKTGHLKKISNSSIYFNSVSYKVNNNTGLIDYDKLEEIAMLESEKNKKILIICGASAYPRDFDYARFREIADKSNAYLMADMAHISGLVATQEHNNPFDFCDVVTTTTHKTLRGPRSALIFSKKHLETKINLAVFPASQGGPHNNTISAVSVALKEANTIEFKSYIKQVKLNARVLAKKLSEYGYKIVTNGTDNHIVLWDLRPLNLTGSKMEKICEFVNITLNKNSVCGDTSALSPGGVRIGTSALTTRGLLEKDFEIIAELLHETCILALSIQVESGKFLKDFENILRKNNKVKVLNNIIQSYASTFKKIENL
jgi:glycine hydroxymethyltransferase